MNIFITQLAENPRYFFLVTLAVIPSICLHEYFHAQVALWCGDDTAARNGHLTLNPLKQMGWISLIMFFFIGIAWGQVPVDPRRLTRKQDALVSFAGPFMNLVLAAGAWIACIFLPRFAEAGVVPELLFLYIFVLGMYNIVLFVINMLPIPGLDGSRLDIVLMQMVNLMRDGKPVRMSKRTGKAITLTDLLEEVPIDSARFLFNMHDAGSGIDFDLDQAVKTDNDNPVYYVQYAHARICSILKKMESEGVAFAGAEQVDATLLTDPSEMDLIRMLAAFPQEIVMAAEKYDPSRINRFVIDLASAFHRFYGNCRIQGADPAVQQARLALCIGVKNVIFNVLTMFKINVPEKM